MYSLQVQSEFENKWRSHEDNSSHVFPTPHPFASPWHSSIFLSHDIVASSGLAVEDRLIQSPFCNYTPYSCASTTPYSSNSSAITFSLSHPLALSFQFGGDDQRYETASFTHSINRNQKPWTCEWCSEILQRSEPSSRTKHYNSRACRASQFLIQQQSGLGLSLPTEKSVLEVPMHADIKVSTLSSPHVETQLDHLALLAIEDQELAVTNVGPLSSLSRLDVNETIPKHTFEALDKSSTNSMERRKMQRLEREVKRLNTVNQAQIKLLRQRQHQSIVQNKILTKDVEALRAKPLVHNEHIRLQRQAMDRKRKREEMKVASRQHRNEERKREHEGAKCAMENAVLNLFQRRRMDAAVFKEAEAKRQRNEDQKARPDYLRQQYSNQTSIISKQMPHGLADLQLSKQGVDTRTLLQREARKERNADAMEKELREGLSMQERARNALLRSEKDRRIDLIRKKYAHKQGKEFKRQQMHHQMRSSFQAPIPQMRKYQLQLPLRNMGVLNNCISRSPALFSKFTASPGVLIPNTAFRPSLFYSTLSRKKVRSANVHHKGSPSSPANNKSVWTKSRSCTKGFSTPQLRASPFSSPRVATAQVDEVPCGVHVPDEDIVILPSPSKSDSLTQSHSESTRSEARRIKSSDQDSLNNKKRKSTESLKNCHNTEVSSNSYRVKRRIVYNF